MAESRYRGVFHRKKLMKEAKGFTVRTRRGYVRLCALPRAVEDVGPYGISRIFLRTKWDSEGCVHWREAGCLPYVKTGRRDVVPYKASRALSEQRSVINACSINPSTPKRGESFFIFCLKFFGGNSLIPGFYHRRSARQNRVSAVEKLRKRYNISFTCFPLFFKKGFAKSPCKKVSFIPWKGGRLFRGRRRWGRCRSVF